MSNNFNQDKSHPLEAVSVPDELKEMFKKSEQEVRDYFRDRRELPEKGMIEIQGDRYVLVKASSMSSEFFDLVNSLYRDRGKDESRRVASGLLFDFAHALGKADARSFHDKMKLDTPLEKLSVGPVHFAYTGWAYVKILPGSAPSPDDDFYLIYEHPFSFEADSWMKKKKEAEHPVCIMNAGYSSGWTEESFGFPLVSVEVECRAMGDEQCRFIMSPPDKIEKHVARYHLNENGGSLDIKSGPLDIPEFFRRKRLEDELKNSEETARALINANSESVLLLDLDGTILAINLIGAERFDMTPEFMMGMNIFDFMTPALRKSRMKEHEEVIRTGKQISYCDKRSHRWLDTRLYPVKDTSGKIIRIAVYSQDITAQKRSEEELKRHKEHLEEMVAERTRELEDAYSRLLREIETREHAERELQDEKERLAVTLNSIGEGVIVTDIKGSVTLLNPAAENLSGWTSEAAVGQSIDDVLPLVGTKKGKKERISINRRMKGTYGVELLEDIALVSKTGGERFFISTLTPIRDESEMVIGFVCVIRDVTEEKKMEEELLRQQKIESLGILAGGIAHDFNNLLTGILGNISLVKYYMKETDKNYKRLEACETAGMRAKNLTQQLLTFSKGGAPVKRVIHLNHFLEETVEFVLSGSKVEGVYQVPEDSWPVELDEGQFSQVIHNLVINAVHSMPDGGLFRVRVKNLDPPDKQIPIACNRCVEISLTDEGCGIPKRNISKVFDPYFTTRKTGSGLGLTTVYSIVKKHNGHVRVESEAGKGTTFFIYLPASHKTPEVMPGETKSRALKAKKGRILLMDDEEIIREVGQEILKSMGYETLAASDGREALKIYKEYLKAGKRFDAVIMDLTVPGGMGGKELAKALLKIDPEVNAVVSSGYSNDPVMADHKNYGFKGVMSKPYRIEEMTLVLKDLLTSPGQEA